MNKSRINIFIAILLCMLPVSCNEDFDVALKGITEPVIYSVINPIDTTSYVLLTRCFIGDSINNSIISDGSRLYFNKASVVIDVNTEKGFPVKSLNLTKVVLPDKQNGIFPSSPNYAFQLNEPLAPYLKKGFQVRLVANVGDLNNLVTAQQTYYDIPLIIRPKQGQWTTYSLYSSDPNKIEWEDKLGYRKYEVEVRMNYQNHFTGHNEQAFTSCYFYELSRIRDTDIETKTITHILYPADFYRIIGARLPDNPDVIWRTFVSLDFIVRGLSSEFCDYQESSQIADDHSGQPISNIVGGIGLFSLVVSSESKGFRLDNQSLDSLVEGQYTKTLRFEMW